MFWKERHAICIYLILIGYGCLLLGAAPVQAEVWVRMQRNGVIYYSFSDPGAKSQNLAPAAWRRPPTFLTSARRAQAAPQTLQPLIQEAGRRYELPEALIKAIILVESNFNPEATSPKGAQGLMQLMPTTAADLQVTDPYDMRENIMSGSRYISLLLQKFRHRLPLALAAYNAGPQRVVQRQSVPPILETQEFVRNVCTHFLNYKGEKPPAHEAASPGAQAPH